MEKATKKIASELAEAAAFVISVFCVAFTVPVQSGGGYRKEVRRFAHRLLGRELRPNDMMLAEMREAELLEFPASQPIRLTVVANNAIADGDNRFERKEPIQMVKLRAAIGHRA